MTLPTDIAVGTADHHDLHNAVNREVNALAGHALAEETFPRWLVTSHTTNWASGAMWLAYFTARNTQDYSKVVTATAGTAAAATPTLCRVGIYAVADTGALTLLAATANTTTLWAATWTKYETALAAPASLVAGQRYALGRLCVSGATMPGVLGSGNLVSADILAMAPRVSAHVTSQTDLPGAVAAGSVANFGPSWWGALLA